MTLKFQVADQLASVVGEIERRGNELPAHLNDAKKAFADWGDRARRFVRRNPGVVIIGAFAIGFALAKAARHA